MIDGQAPNDDEIERLSGEIVSRWLPTLMYKDWHERLELLNEMHEQLKEDLADLDLYCALSPVLVRKIIDRLPQEDVASDDQAQIFSNSDSEEHRRLALEWFSSTRNPQVGGNDRWSN